MALSALIAALVAGALGGVHCIAMCGGFVAALSGAADGAAPLRPAADLVRRQLAYSAGRLATYTLLGALAGGLGSAILAGAQWLPLTRALYVVANLLLLAVGVAVAGRAAQVAWLTRAGGALFARVAPVIGPLVRRDSTYARIALGMLWGLVPCGLVYGMLPIALFTGSAAAGALVMLAFGIGTLPNLVAAGFAVARTRRWLESRRLRYAAAALLIGFAVVGLARALGPLAHGQGAFCLTV